MRKMVGKASNKDGEPLAKRKRIPNSLYHNEMFIVMETSPDRMKMKSRKTEPIPQHIIAQGRKSTEKRKSLSNFDGCKAKKSYTAELPLKSSAKAAAAAAASVAQKKNHEEDSKQLKNTPKVVLKLQQKKYSASVKMEEAIEYESNIGRSYKKTKEEVQVPVADYSDYDDSEFDSGRRFKSFDDFCDVFECWKVKRKHNFRVASSETLKNIDGSVDPRCRYRYVVYQCVHYGQPRIRGTGKRPNQTYLPCGCNAMLRLVYNFNEKVLVISKLIKTHTGHEHKSMEEYNSQVRRQHPKSMKAETSSSPGSPNESTSRNISSHDIKPECSPNYSEEKEPEKMTDSLYYQQQLQLMAALLPPTMGSSLSTDYSNVFNNYNIHNVSNPDTIYRPQPQYSLSAVHNSAFSRVQPLSNSTTPPNDKENSTHNSTNLSMKMDVADCALHPPPALSAMDNTGWVPREYSDLTVL